MKVKFSDDHRCKSGKYVPAAKQGENYLQRKFAAAIAESRRKQAEAVRDREAQELRDAAERASKVTRIGRKT